jgi:hypothetical protein
MAEKLDNKDLVTLDELTLSNAWELEALVDGLTAKGIITKREVLDMLMELRPRNPEAATPANELSTDPHKTDVLVSHILEIFNSTGLTAQQAKDLLVHLQVLIEIGKRIAHGKTTH